MFLCSAHPPKKPNFFKVAKIITCDILLTVEKHITTLAVNRLACPQPLCAILCNSLHYHPCYGETRVWGWYNVHKSAGTFRVNRDVPKFFFTFISPYSAIKWSNSIHKAVFLKKWYCLLTLNSPESTIVVHYEIIVILSCGWPCKIE